MYVLIKKKNTCWSSRKVKTQHFTITPLCLSSLYNCVIAGGLSLTSPLKLMSYLSRSIVSVWVHSRSLSLSTRGRSDGRARSPVKAWRWLVQQKFNDSRASSEEQVGKTSSSLQCPMEGRGKPEREGGESEGVSERERENTRGYYRSYACLSIPHRAATLHTFPLRTFKQCSTVTRSHSFLFFLYMQHISLPKFHWVEGVSAYSHIFAPSTGFKWRSVSWRPPGKGAESTRRSRGILRPRTLTNRKSIGWML